MCALGDFGLVGIDSRQPKVLALSPHTCTRAHTYAHAHIRKQKDTE